jgi:hypothetical protein
MSSKNMTQTTILDLPNDMLNVICTYLDFHYRQQFVISCKTLFSDRKMLGLSRIEVERYFMEIVKDVDDMEMVRNGPFTYRHIRTCIERRNFTQNIFNNIRMIIHCKTHELWQCDFSVKCSLNPDTYLFWFCTTIVIPEIEIISSDKNETIHDASQGIGKNNMIRFVIKQKTDIEIICKGERGYNDNKHIFFMLCVPENFYRTNEKMFLSEGLMFGIPRKIIDATVFA